MRGFSSSRVEGKQVASLLLGETELDLEGLRHLWGRGTGEPQLDLDTVVDEPLQGGESTDHDDPWSETGPHASEAEIPGGAAEGGALSLVHVRDDGVGGVGHHGAEHTSNVTGGECDNELFALGALRTGLGYHVGVQELHGLLEAGELHHGVGDLSAPQRNKRLVESVDSLILENEREGSPEGGGEGSGQGGLHPHLAALHGRESNVSEELSAGRGSQVEAGSVQEGVLLSHSVAVQVLEDLVEAELAETLGRVADGGGSPAQEQALGASISYGHLETVSQILVLLLVHLNVNLKLISATI